MIEKESARSGHIVLRKDGKFLDSSVDPVKSAEKWAIAAKARLGDAPSAVVMGIGSGYHIVALQAIVPNVKLIVVECDSEVAKSACEIHPELMKITIIVDDDWSRLLEHESIRAMTHEVFRILKYPPSIQANDLFFNRAEALILARDRIGFFLQIRDRSDLLRTLQMEKLEAVPAGSPISIKTILECQKLGGHGAYEREALLWKILGELVK